MDVGQKRDEFGVVSFLKQARITRELVHHLTPGVVGIRRLEHLTMLLDLFAFANRHELQRPEQDLPEMPDDLVGVGGDRVRHSRDVMITAPLNYVATAKSKIEHSRIPARRARTTSSNGCHFL